MNDKKPANGESDHSATSSAPQTGAEEVTEAGSAAPNYARWVHQRMQDLTVAEQGITEAPAVLTPGGPRPDYLVHAVPTNAVVQASEPGAALGIAPEEALLTPGGYRPRSYVHLMEPGTVLQLGARFHLITSEASGALRAAIPTAPRAEAIPALGSGWITYAFWNNGTGSPISQFGNTWTVPPVPEIDNGQTIFLFPGIQNFGANFGILQPVLQFGTSAAGGGRFWSIGSWYVTSDGQAFHSILTQVSPGDSLTGIMGATGHAGTSFDYTCTFAGVADSRLTVTGIAELLWANVTLEAYGITDCSDYPNAPDTTFTAIQLTTETAEPPLVWTPQAPVSDCGQHITILDNSPVSGSIQIAYR